MGLQRVVVDVSALIQLAEENDDGQTKSEDPGGNPFFPSDFFKKRCETLERCAFLLELVNHDGFHGLGVFSPRLQRHLRWNAGT